MISNFLISEKISDSWYTFFLIFFGPLKFLFTKAVMPSTLTVSTYGYAQNTEKKIGIELNKTMRFCVK